MMIQDISTPIFLPGGDYSQKHPNFAFNSAPEFHGVVAEFRETIDPVSFRNPILFETAGAAIIKQDDIVYLSVFGLPGSCSGTIDNTNFFSVPEKILYMRVSVNPSFPMNFPERISDKM